MKRSGGAARRGAASSGLRLLQVLGARVAVRCGVVVILIRAPPSHLVVLETMSSRVLLFGGKGCPIRLRYLAALTGAAANPVADTSTSSGGRKEGKWTRGICRQRGLNSQWNSASVEVTAAGKSKGDRELLPNTLLALRMMERNWFSGLASKHDRERALRA